MNPKQLYDSTLRPDGIAFEPYISTPPTPLLSPEVPQQAFFPGVLHYKEKGSTCSRSAPFDAVSQSFLARSPTGISEGAAAAVGVGIREPPAESTYVRSRSCDWVFRLSAAYTGKSKCCGSAWKSRSGGVRITRSD
jgi:hypothetical protein